MGGIYGDNDGDDVLEKQCQRQNERRLSYGSSLWLNNFTQIIKQFVSSI